MFGAVATTLSPRGVNPKVAIQHSGDGTPGGWKEWGPRITEL